MIIDTLAYIIGYVVMIACVLVGVPYGVIRVWEWLKRVRRNKRQYTFRFKDTNRWYVG